MDRDLVYRYSESRRFGIKGIWTSRGCIFPCPYCFNNRYNEIFKNSGGIVRRRSVDSIIRETRELSEVYPVKFIRIQDDVFTHKADDWLKEFAQRWSEEIHLSFYCLLRAELVTDKMAFYLKKAGCFSICMSIESANDDVRMRMMRRNVTKNQLENAFCIFKKYKINVYTNTMVGLPFTTLKQDIESLDFAVKVQPEFPDFSIFMPYPGTDLGDYCKRAGIYDPVEDEITYGMRNMSPLACFTKKEKEVQYNICELAIVAVRFPFLRNLIVKHFIYWKPNKIFFLIQYFSAIAAYGRKIFYYKHTFTEYGELLLKTFKFYLYDFTKKKEKCDIKRIQKGSLEAFFVLTQEERFSEFKKCLEAMSTHKNILLKS